MKRVRKKVVKKSEETAAAAKEKEKGRVGSGEESREKQ
jgi:hypothetical protein